MSDGYDGGDYGHIDQGAEQYDLDHGHQEQAYDQHHDANYDAYAQAHNHNLDVDYDNGHAVEYHAPDGSSYAEKDFTHLDVHESDSEAAYAQHYDQHDDSHSYNEADYLKEHFADEFLHADYLNSGEGHNYLDSADGHSAIAAK